MTMRSVFGFGMGVPIALPQDPAPRCDQRNEAKPGERTRRGRKLRSTITVMAALRRLTARAIGNLPEYRAHLSSTDIARAWLAGAPFNYRKPRIFPFPRAEEQCASKCPYWTQGRETPETQNVSECLAPGEAAI